MESPYKYKLKLIILNNYFLLFLVVSVFSGCQKQDEVSIIPDEVAHKTGYVNYSSPPKDFKSITGWITAIDDRFEDSESLIEIDFIRLYCNINGIDSLIGSNEYNDEIAEGGLFTRNPWFGSNTSTAIPYEFSEDGCLVLRTSSESDFVWHIWNKSWPRIDVPTDSESCWLEVKCRISGSALIQIGIDYWRNGTCEYAGYNINNVEAGVSDWYYNQNEWLVLTFGKD